MTTIDSGTLKASYADFSKFNSSRSPVTGSFPGKNLESTKDHNADYNVFKGSYSYPIKRSRSEKIVVYVRKQD